MWYSLDIRDGTGIPVGWPPRQQGNRRKSKCVFPQYQWVAGQVGEKHVSHAPLHVTPDSWPSCYAVLLSKPNFVLPISHTLAPNWQMKRPNIKCLPTLCLAYCSSSDLEQYRGWHNILLSDVQAREASASSQCPQPSLPPLTVPPASRHHIHILLHSNSVLSFHPDTFWSRGFLLEYTNQGNKDLVHK